MAEFGVKPSPEESLEVVDSAFDELNDTFRLSPTVTAPLKAEIIKHYSEGHRRHHAISHLGELVVFTNTYEVPSGLKIHRGDLLWMVMYHDIVYDINENVKDAENIAKSRDIAKGRLTQAGVPQPNRVHVAAGIDATAQHDTGIEDDTIAFFLDADMSILGAPDQRYDEYAEDIEYEFTRTFSLDQYRSGRKYFLNKTLGENRRIFNTDFAHHLLQQQAVDNMRRELERL